MAQPRDVQELFDRTDIVDLMYRYCRGADIKDIEEMCSVFTEECEYDLGHGPDMVRRSRAELVEMAKPMVGKVFSGSHYISNAEVVFESRDRALLYCYMASWQKLEPAFGGGNVHRSGRYEALCVREAEGWLFKAFRLVVAGPDLISQREAEHVRRRWPPQFPGL